MRILIFLTNQAEGEEAGGPDNNSVLEKSYSEVEMKVESEVINGEQKDHRTTCKSWGGVLLRTNRKETPKCFPFLKQCIS